ncbi:DUF1722 domain-containing protein [Thalassomonas viridans]|uniref:DUF1722 domain-containing protein n=1 Tax=Thalassomonas viridans TaxID=137584 RepID=A0AAF0C8T1_9GAMM|nr:DUF523 and DUF1722 domain-containing protein [Thalassomonas viridans]WDE04184.1 DUF1722 domain-containing protein [Thalassomonas viridans]
MSQDIVIGISACLLGENVRFDGGSKTSQFCVSELEQHVRYQAFCPEVAVGLPVPRKTIRQIRQGDVIRVSRPDGTGDVTEALAAYGKKVAQLASGFSGYVFCAKSPSCGMERVKIYDADGQALPANGTGVFANEIIKANPLLPCEENGRLNDAVLRENFIARVFVYHSWRMLTASGLSRHKLMSFHSRHKYMLMSHDLLALKSLGRLLADDTLTLDEMAGRYISGLMAALKKTATRKKHVNTLQHLQGYFSRQLTKAQRQELTEQIDDYRKGLLPLMAPLTLIKHYLLSYPQAYLAQQTYLTPHPAQLKLRYGF